MQIACIQCSWWFHEHAKYEGKSYYWAACSSSIFLHLLCPQNCQSDNKVESTPLPLLMPVMVCMYSVWNESGFQCIHGLDKFVIHLQLTWIFLFSRQLQGLEKTKKMDGFPVWQVSLARHCIGENGKNKSRKLCLYKSTWWI